MKALQQLVVSDKITQETRARSSKIRPQVQEVVRAYVSKGAFAELSSSYADAVFMGLADATILFATREPARAEAYKAAGFKVLWKGLEK